MAAKQKLLGLVCWLVSLAFSAQQASANDIANSTCPVEGAEFINATQVMDLWPGPAPGSEHWEQREVEHDFGMGGPPNWIVRNVVTPTLAVYLPEPAAANGTAVVIAPGGGFLMLSVENEGHMLARCLAAQGIAAFVLKYRLVTTPAPEEEFRKLLFTLFSQVRAGHLDDGLFSQDRFAAVVKFAGDDGLRALALVRANAKKWNIAADRVGMLGFSAGARVTATALLAADGSARPDFAGFLYGGLFGDEASLPERIPPVFAAVAADDDLALATTRDLVGRLLAAGEKPEFHLYTSGGHGFGMVKRNEPSDDWIDSWLRWMADHGWISAYPKR